MIKVYIKRLFVAIGLLATLTACEEGDIVIDDLEMEDVTNVEEESIEEVDAVVPASTPVEEVEIQLTQDDYDYIEILNKVKDINATELGNLSSLINQFVENPSVATADEYVSNFRGSILKMNLVLAMLTEMEGEGVVPEKFVESHNKFIEVFELQISSYNDTLTGFINMDRELIDSGTLKMNEVTSLIQEHKDDVNAIIN